MQEGSLLELLVVTFLCGAAFGAAAALCYARPTFRRLERLEKRMQVRRIGGQR